MERRFRAAQYGDRAQRRAPDGKAVGAIVSVGRVDIRRIKVEVAGVGSRISNR